MWFEGMDYIDELDDGGKPEKEDSHDRNDESSED